MVVTPTHAVIAVSACHIDTDLKSLNTDCLLAFDHSFQLTCLTDQTFCLLDQILLISLSLPVFKVILNSNTYMLLKMWAVGEWTFHYYSFLKV